MQTAIDALTYLGTASLNGIWLPLAAWTVLWLITEVVLRLASGVHPVVRYRVVQAVLFSLPLGILAGAVVDLSALLPAGLVIALLPEIVVTPLATEVPEAASGAAAILTAASLGISGWTVLGLLVALGAAVAIARLARLGTHAAALRRLRRRLSPATTDGLGEAVQQAAGRLGVRQRVEVIAAADAEVPMTFGLARPLIVLPSWLSAEDRRLALLHEMAHVRQRDYAAQWLEALVAALFALHPGIHAMRRRCELLRELTCDAALLGEASVSRRAYASLVYSFVSPPARATPVSVGMADRPSHIHQRFQAMKSFRSSHRPARLAWTAALGVLLGCSLILGASGVLAQDPPDRGTRIVLGDGISSTTALVIIDGERTDANALQRLDPGDIQMIEVFKGDTAEARFGPEGRDGVVVVTTKAGSVEEPSAASDATADVFVVVEQMPEPIGGLTGIQERVVYPELARRAGIEGTVFVQFIVDEEGGTQDIEVVRGIGAGADEAAVHAVEQTHFTPGRQRGQEVKVRMSLPVRFRLPEGEAAAAAPPPEPPTPAGRPAGDDAPAEFGTHGVFPNPTQDAVAIAFSLPEATEVRVELYDMAGRRVLVSEQSFPAGARHTFQVPTDGLAAGTYAFRLHASGESAAGTLTIAR